jgi:murein L,D-transpeptidase YafK
LRIRSIAAALAFLALASFVWANWPHSALAPSVQAERVIIEKSARRLTLLAHGVPVKTYRVALGGEPVGPKRREGDRRTPEGVYTVDSRLERSGFHRALHISYPSEADRRLADSAGFAPGGAIMIHGIRNGLGWLGRAHRAIDWTSGCVAVTNPEIEELWRAVPDGTPVEIRP